MQVFRAAIDDYAERLCLRHGERLVSLYLMGSIARGEAVPGLSDVNLLAVFRDAAPGGEPESAWNQETSRALEEQYPELRREPAAGSREPLFTCMPLLLSEISPPTPDTEGFATDEVLELHWGGQLLRGEEIRPLMPPCPPPHLPHARSWAERARRTIEAFDVSKEVHRPLATLARDAEDAEGTRRGVLQESSSPRDSVSSASLAKRAVNPSVAGHCLAKAALTCCLAVLVAEGQGFTLQSSVIAERIGERHPEWADWAQEFVRSRLDPPTDPEHLAALAEAARLLCDWSSTILHTIGLPHNLRV
jgi:hypothetical protein